MSFWPARNETSLFSGEYPSTAAPPRSSAGKAVVAAAICRAAGGTATFAAACAQRQGAATKQHTAASFTAEMEGMTSLTPNGEGGNLRNVSRDGEGCVLARSQSGRRRAFAF